MRIERLTLHDFKSYQDADLDLSGVSLASVVGPNGAGKSSILEACIFALTGGRKLRDLDSFVRKGCEECRVALTFSISGQRYRLTRTRSSRGAGKSTLELAREEAGFWVAEGTQVKDTEQRIAAILAVDEEILLLTSIITQEDAGSFFRPAPAQRLEGLGRILQLDQVYEPIRIHMKDQADGHKAALDAARRDVERMGADMVHLALLVADLAEANERVDGTKAALVAAEAAFDETQRAHAEAQKAVDGTAAILARYDALKARHQELERSAGRLEQEERDLRQRTNQRQELQAALATKADLLQAIADHEARREEDAKWSSQEEFWRRDLLMEKAAAKDVAQQGQKIEATAEADNTRLDALLAKVTRIEQAEAPICDRCGQPIADEALARTLDQLTTETVALAKRISEASVERDGLRIRYSAHVLKVHDLQEQIAGLPAPTFDAQAYDRATKALRDLEAIPARLAAIDALSERLMACLRELDYVIEQLEDRAACADLAAAQKAAEAVTDLAAAASRAKTEVEIRQATLDGCRGALSTAEKAAARIEGEIAAMAEVPASLDRAQAEAKDHEQNLADFELLKRAFSKTGIPALIVQNVLLALEIQVNELLGLYDGGLALRFENEKENKDGSSRVSLEIMVFDGAGWRAYETFSGGERYRVASAMRLGLARLLAHRSGARVETLIVDEPEGLDTTGRAHLARILEQMSTDFGLVLLLTHYDDLKDAMPQRIIVSRGEDGLSQAEVSV
jgi:DNA repair protein SbcC/Rad50